MTSKMEDFLLQAYLNREMDPQTEADFEIELIRNPALAELAFADSALLAGLNPGLDGAEQIAAMAQIAEAEATQAPSARVPADEVASGAAIKPTNLVIAHNSGDAPSAREREQALERQREQAHPRRTTSYKFFPLALAASVSALCAGLLGYAMRKPQIYGGAELVYIDKQRSLSAAIEIPLPKSGPLLLLVPVANVSPCVADIRLTQSGQSIKVQAKPDEFGFASLILPGDALKPGSVNIRVLCDGKVVGGFDAQVVSQ